MPGSCRKTASAPDNVHIGKRKDNSHYFPGRVDEVHIFSRVLSDAEIARLAGITLPFDKPL
ncbi:MAG TPA: LamG-like jellyroll fold domain-containing protein [Sedimentisphaerales bacterium]|nr:LamG-like jellyroll fold domain-containing protein [Sedimentisphaerales bacterium]